MRPLAGILSFALAVSAGAQRPVDSVTAREIAPGVTHVRMVRPAGPWVINLVRVDLRRSDLTLRHVRALDELRGREKTSTMAARLAARGEMVLAAVNADFFDLATGENENNQVVDGEWWKGVKVTDSPFGTFGSAHGQFALDAAGRPLLDRFRFDGTAWFPGGTLPLIALNQLPRSGPEAVVLYTPRIGTTPRDTLRTVAEAPLASAGRRHDTLLFVRRGGAATAGGNAVPAAGAVLAGYGARAREVTRIAEGDTVRVLVGAAPGRAPLQLLVGGWPRIVRDGANVAAQAAAEEGTISRNADVRHPRTAIGFSRDSANVLLVTVDGRSRVSAGMTLVELADLMRELGAWHALNFDGGGSTTMIVRDAIVNSPSDPSGERPVGNALFLLRRLPR